jgi:transcriptional regulator of arginine metabolism
MAVSTVVSAKRERQRAIRDLIAREPIGSQGELAERLAVRGFAVTQATVSRDIGELGLVKIPRADRHVYVAPEDLGAPAPAGGSPRAARGATTSASDERLQRILADVPVRVGRSGLTIVLNGTPGTASIIAQAIDESSLQEQEGTLAGDNTLLVLFADEARLERWLERFREIQPTPVTASPSAPALAPRPEVDR